MDDLLKRMAAAESGEEYKETPPKDTLPADTPPVDTPPVETPPADTPPADEPPTVDENEIFSRKFGETFEGKSVEEIQTALSAEVEPEFANDFMKKANEFVKQGGKASDFIRTQSVDYSEMTAEQRIKEQMKLDDPDASQAEIDLAFDDTYGIEDPDDETEKLRMQRKLRLADKEATKQLEAYKEKWTAIEEPHKKPEEKNDKPSQEEIEALNAKWSQTVETSLENFSEIEVTIGDNDVFKFAITDEAKGKVKETTKNIASFLQRYVNEDGTENMAKLNRDMAILENLQSYTQSVATTYKSKGREELLAEIENPEFKHKKVGNENDDKPKNLLDAAAKAGFFQ
jgi:hypothetical protein